MTLMPPNFSSVSNSVFNQTLVLALLTTNCAKSEPPRSETPTNLPDRVAAAAHLETTVFGPIWPHDSACFAWLRAEVAAGRLRSADDETAAKAFGNCTDTSELEARKHPLTPQRRATIRARQAMGLPPLPLTSFDSSR